MQKSDKRSQSAHRKVRTSNVRNRKEIQRPAMQAKSIDMKKPASKEMTNESEVMSGEMVDNSTMSSSIISEKRTMAGRPTIKKHSVSIIERDSEPEIIRPTTLEEDNPEEVELLELPESKSEVLNMNPSRMSASQIKERAIAKALSEAARPQKKKVVERQMRTHFKWTRIALAFACASAAVFAIVYFVNVNSPDISMKVAAMQTGIDASYPSYVPRDYSLSDIASENGKITLNFKNSTTGGSFTIIEEKSAWDSNALTTNYVRPEYGNDFTMIREQGLTLFISGSDAAWVNGGVVYKLKTTSGTLTKKQIKAIAVSL